MGRLIYIVSAGHSGSTILDIALGSTKNIFSTGELVWLPWQIYRGPDPNDQQTYCSCGSNFNECAFWSEVNRKLEFEGESLLKNPGAFNIAMYHDFRFDVRPKIDRLKKYLLYRLISILNPRITKLILLNLFKTGIKRNWMLIDKISEISNCDYIVDSSKDYLRMYLLALYRPEDVKVLILIRDIKGVATSGYYNIKDFHKRIKGWNRHYNKRIYPVVRKFPSLEYRVVRYEKFSRYPEKTIQNIRSFLNLYPEKFCNKINTKATHIMGGNPVRHTGELSIRYDERWKERIQKVSDPFTEPDCVFYQENDITDL